ncbi:uncharacterized protein LOC116610891 [Nematostella vectensis]|uniref:uncharacterized protein LOC116610891 n=1 Tax=Nematostella vectensis TaxID=45351 RepID=UPI0020770BB1|nr:uncharacterized protein LOC116610891 [Nematostella vectensis]
MRRQQLTPQRIMGVIETVVQSNQQFVFEGDFRLHVIRTHLPSGAGKNKLKNSCTLNTCDLDAWRKGKKSIIRIENSDELCAARSIVTGMAILTMDPNATKLYKPTWGRTRGPPLPLQTERAKVLHAEAGVPEGPCGIPEIQQFQQYLRGQGFELNVVSREHGNTVIYSGDLPDPKYRLYLYYAKGHFDYVKSMPGLLGRCYYCTICKKGYDSKLQHKCVNSCYGCGEVDCSPLVPPPEQDHRWDWKYCSECNRYFRTPKCFDNHKLVKPRGLPNKKDVTPRSYCQMYHKCETCGKRIDMLATRKEGTSHVCGEYKCTVCKEVVPPDHLCYVTVGANALPKDKDGDDSMRVIVFDVEAMPLGDKHEPNFVGAQKLCDTCKEWPMDRLECTTCGVRKHSFTSIRAFCDWLFGGSNAGYTCLAHNFKGYDSYFILEYLFENGIKPNVIFTGGKVMHLKVDSLNIEMKCTLNFFQMPLSKLPKAFGFDHITQKGVFPHFFNITEHQDYVGPMPDLSYYDLRSMKEEDANAVAQWHQEQVTRGVVFNLREELANYCHQDVEVLKRAVVAFDKLIMDAVGLHPFKIAITIASLSSRILRSKFLEEGKIGLVPLRGYRGHDVQSLKALQWLKYLERRDGVCIRHAGNGGEVRLAGRIKVDGYAADTNTVYQYQGCFYHGCPTCFLPDTVNPLTHTTMRELRDHTRATELRLRALGYNYEEVWECQFDARLSSDVQLQALVGEVEHSIPLNPRDAFFGGRTNAIQLHYEAKVCEGERIHYYDFTSLYPWVNATCEYPVGHPDAIVTENFNEDLHAYKGLMKIRVLPPRDLFFPVLPVRVNQKLMFPLCRSCAEMEEQGSCNHSDEERAFTGTWCHPEVFKAIEEGYTVLRVYEIWHWEKWERLFKGYIDTFLKFKQEASGWPAWCDTDSDKQRYIDEYEQHQGVRLDKEKIAKNPGLRSVAKMGLNCMWGKFGEQPNPRRTKYISEPIEYFDLLTNDSVEVNDVFIVSDDLIQVHYKLGERFQELKPHTNVIIAAFTTAFARLALFGVMRRLGPRCLYHDTDSVIFLHRPGEWKPPLGDYLGDLTSELDEGDFIDCYSSTGPKSYAYTTYSGKSVCKVKGLHLNVRTAGIVNQKTMIELLTGEGDEERHVVLPYTIVRNTIGRTLHTVPAHKTFKMVYNKRVRRGMLTYPYGYYSL